MEANKVIVIGAGLSVLSPTIPPQFCCLYVDKNIVGLSSARLLASHGVDVVVLEAADRVGGRTLTVHPPDDDPSVPKFGWADLGASYVGPSQNHILRLCKELGLGTYLCSDKHDFIHYSKGRQFCYQTTWPNLWWSNPLAYLEVVYMCRLMDNMSKEIPLDKPWKAPRAKEWDKLTVQDFLCRHCWTKYGRQFCYQTTWPNLWWSNPLAYLEVVYMCRLMDNMSKEIPLDKPWKAPRAKEWDKLTVQDFLCRHCWTKYVHNHPDNIMTIIQILRDGVEFLLALCSNNNTADGYEMSLLYYLWYMCQGGGLLNLWRVKGGAQERKIIGGSQQVCLKMAEQLTERVHLNQPVVKINYSTKGVCVQTLDGTEFTGTHLILALPPSLQMKIHFDPPLSSHRYGLLQRSPMGLVLKCIIFFNHPFWAEKVCKQYVSHVDMLFENCFPMFVRNRKQCFQMKIHFDPPLSSHRYGLLQRSPMGLVLKSIIFFNHPFWAEKDTPVPPGLVLLPPHICTPDFPPTPAHIGLLCMGLCQLENA
uniref:monoamine oxidase n=1 Tax=Timema genevievae TaxID=629358 RepID=A0A7R9K611_TIMGE|nr:unnamed protein product [Timema genevievae]